jgi:hypothetical protein
MTWAVKWSLFVAAEPCDAASRLGSKAHAACVASLIFRSHHSDLTLHPEPRSEPQFAFRVFRFPWHNRMERRMSKLALLASAAVLATALVGPAAARHGVVHPNYYAETGVCPGHEPGNPYTQEEDYMAWSGWRARGGWDDRNDLSCLHQGQLRHYGSGF